MPWLIWIRNGYVSVGKFWKIYRGMPSLRPELDCTGYLIDEEEEVHFLFHRHHSVFISLLERNISFTPHRIKVTTRLGFDIGMYVYTTLCCDLWPLPGFDSGKLLTWPKRKPQYTGCFVSNRTLFTLFPAPLYVPVYETAPNWLIVVVFIKTRSQLFPPRFKLIVSRTCELYVEHHKSKIIICLHQKLISTQHRLKRWLW